MGWHSRSSPEWWSSTDDSWNGWLAPDGALTPCLHGRHAETIKRISGRDEGAAERLGWLKLVEGDWLTAEMARPVSQAQFTRIWSWCRQHRRPFPDWLVSENART